MYREQKQNRISIDALALTRVKADRYQHDTVPPDDFYEMQLHYDAECYYHQRSWHQLPTQSIRVEGRRVSHEEVSLCTLSSLEGILPPGRMTSAQVLLVAHSFYTRLSANPMLARLLEYWKKRPRIALGLSHLGEVASTEGVRVADWTLAEGETGVLLLSEQQFFLPHRFAPPPALPLGDATVALSLSKDGETIILEQHKRGVMQNKRILPAWEDWIQQVKRIVEAERDEVDWVVIQQAFSTQVVEDEKLFVRQHQIDHNLQCTDVWITLAEGLTQNVIRVGDRVLLLSFDRLHTYSMIQLLVQARPRMSDAWI
ncbi:hypothetical protein [Mechercharimyces sp. CAU 1602]|uniref:hypothetical protein n=1 Tax=Mechercharimyces sp. CAU 1602 TaxID=2973933 RepID=UPI002162EE11|nr:hypothetical protein [Mechercharimyces sp. CAU 1602]MCS1352497.1 hypothetical protein [Mechercharimyces sp. CAU 1602]